jgi:hypothetical protein
VTAPLLQATGLHARRSMRPAWLDRTVPTGRRPTSPTAGTA